MDKVKDSDVPNVKSVSDQRKDKKNQRLGQALRENLRKRKEQARLRKEQDLLKT